MNPKPPQKRLGRGLSSLISGDLSHGFTDSKQRRDLAVIPTHAPGNSTFDKKPIEPQVSSHRLASLPINTIRANPLQPRKVFDEVRLSQLADSIRQQGTLQPIVVRPAPGGYELVAGERRLRASKLAGLQEIQAIVRTVPDHELLELALVENIQRADLDPVERARGYRLLIEKYQLTHDQIAGKMGEDRATVSNYLRILSLDAFILDALSAGELATGHAKALLAISDEKSRNLVAKQAIAEGWSVRRLEAEAAGRSKPPKVDIQKNDKRPAVADLEERLRQSLGARVTIREGRRRHSGRLTIEYNGLDDFERILRRLGIEDDKP
ncbi:MAG TPA: ParB/RepB/Spo0J family partition protein [Phycisphaerae bacterium]|nr:ParB/RepB/Spo0J family partition protein [Phycisphaerae bacterium]